MDEYRSIKDFEKLGEEISKREKQTEKEPVAESFTDTFFKQVKKADAKKESLKMLILGHPGSGKTTLFKWIALQCVKPKTDETSMPFSGFIPCFISLKDFAKNQDWFHKDLEEVVLSKIGLENLDTPFYKDCFERSEIVFLLDGLDEVADEDLRRDVIIWIQNQNIRRNKLLVSSRFSGLNPQKGLLFNAGFKGFIIEDLDDADIEQFLQKWYEAIETIGENSDKNRQEAKRQANELIGVIKSKGYEPLRKIAVNPLLLTIVAIVHRNRAKLPKERHKLYEECLNVMIELWHITHKQLKVSFPAEVCKNNLAILANYAMHKDTREVSKQEIISLLPATIESHPLDFFLNEMVLKAGLLYESEGKYGFLHLTFQEYLAAYYFAHSSQPLEILENRDKDYWSETIKLFVNIGNTRQFFNEVIGNLDEKYWPNMNLWEACLRDELIDEKVKEEIEIKFALEVCQILQTIPFEESEEAKIVQLFPHYPLYVHAQTIELQGWELFHYANHPFVKTVGASILNRCDSKTQSVLFDEMRVKLNSQMPNESLIAFMEYDNLFLLLIAKRLRIIDFTYAISLFRIENYIFQLLYLRDFLMLLDLQEILNLPFMRKLLELTGLLELQYLLKSKSFENLRDFRCLQDLQEIKDFHLIDSFYFRNLDYLRSLKYFKDLRDFQLHYEQKYKAILEQHQPKIHAWANKALAKLQNMSDKEILKYFPNSTAEDFKEFRASKS